MKGSHKVSILQGTEKQCYKTGDTHNLHKHHIYYGTGLRAISDKHGFWVWLRADYHNQADYGVHGKDGHVLSLMLKQDCQKKFEETHTREEFRAIIGKSYL